MDPGQVLILLLGGEQWSSSSPTELDCNVPLLFVQVTELKSETEAENMTPALNRPHLNIYTTCSVNSPSVLQV